MKYRSITLLTAALLLTGCTAANQTDPAAELTEQTGVQTEETTGAETDAPDVPLPIFTFPCVVLLVAVLTVSI